ncbi:MAG: amidohydrolase family protein [Dehalococcoidales bacterium]|nr:amidohydrolase family protein [Dehalococcoidales bacterium]MDZ4230351.1 amidohydrolase family protein [Dehalococcoidales bacterium]
MKIDVFSHILPPRYKDALYRANPRGFHLQNVIESLPTLFDMEHRFRVMDKFDGLQQVLTLSSPPIEHFTDTRQAADFARLANDEMAELVLKFPGRFPAAVASLPMNDMESALREVDRAVNDLKMKGVQIFTPTNDMPLDSPEFLPLYEKMAHYDLPIWIHPHRDPGYADYKTETRSRYMIFSNFGWPYETTVAMTRLVFSGILEKFPDLKFITHHCGGMVPFFEQRIIGAYDHAAILRGARYKDILTREPIEYFKKFYYDTAIYGSTPGLMCAHAFCGTGQMLFATDFPFDSQFGERYTRQTIRSIEQMDIEDGEKSRIFEGNIRQILRLPA